MNLKELQQRFKQKMTTNKFTLIEYFIPMPELVRKEITIFRNRASVTHSIIVWEFKLLIL